MAVVLMAIFFIFGPLFICRRSVASDLAAASVIRNCRRSRVHFDAHELVVINRCENLLPVSKIRHCFCDFAFQAFHQFQRDAKGVA